MWADDLDRCDVPPVVSHRWDRVTVRLADRGPIELSRPYVWLDNDATRDRLLAHIGPSGRIEGAVRDDGVHVEADALTVVMQDGTTWRASVVIDASGAGSPFVQRAAGPAPGWQSAWGVTGRVAGAIDPTELRLMDFSESFEDGFGPGFLYALPLGRDRWFLEETSLVRPEPLPWHVLQQRLDIRMARLGLRWIDRDEEVEQCRIPMGGPLPRAGSSVVAFGAAAGLVHPATGYSVALSMRLAGPVAEAIAQGLATSSAAARAAAWDTVWPADRVRAWDLYTFGMHALARQDDRAINDHFAAFFAVEPTQWAAWLSATATPAELRATMWAVFRRASMAARGRLMAAGVKRGASRLYSGLFGTGRLPR
jgi:lycopene cyclase-like protein